MLLVMVTVGTYLSETTTTIQVEAADNDIMIMPSSWFRLQTMPAPAKQGKSGEREANRTAAIMTQEMKM